MYLVYGIQISGRQNFQFKNNLSHFMGSFLQEQNSNKLITPIRPTYKHIFTSIAAIIQLPAICYGFSAFVFMSHVEIILSQYSSIAQLQMTVAMHREYQDGCGMCHFGAQASTNQKRRPTIWLPICLNHLRQFLLNLATGCLPAPRGKFGLIQHEAIGQLHNWPLSGQNKKHYHMFDIRDLRAPFKTVIVRNYATPTIDLFGKYP